MKEEKMECPHCLGIGEEYNRRTKQGKLCHLCNGNGTVDEIIADAYIHNNVPIIDY